VADFVTSGQRRLLVVDDDVAVRELVRATLESETYEIIEANDGEEALRMIRENLPQLVLLDIMMPGRSGTEVCRLVKSDPETSAVVVVMLTAKSDPGEREAALAAGADSYFVKPFSPVALLRKVDEVLGIIGGQDRT